MKHVVDTIVRGALAFDGGVNVDYDAPRGSYCGGRCLTVIVVVVQEGHVFWDRSRPTRQSLTL